MTTTHPPIDAAAPVVSVEELADDADPREWEVFVASTPGASGYHSWPWRHVLKNALGHDSVYLVARADGRIVGVLPLIFVKSRLFGRSLTSMAFLNYGGVLTDSPLVGRRLIEAAAAAATQRQCRHVELRHTSQQFPDLPFRQHKVTMLLPLKDGMWEGLDRKVRNQVRKAQKSALTVERGGLTLLSAFYQVFSRNMRDLGTPVYSPRLFEEVLRQFAGRAELHVVRLGRSPVAAGLTFRTAGTMEVPWASSIREYNTLCPNHLLYWNMIESAVAARCEIFDFGRSTPDEGTYRFKEQWGAQPLPLHWEYVLAEGRAVPDGGPSNPRFRLVIEAWKRLPLFVATRLGPHIVRGIP